MPVCLDISRLLSRAGKKALTGIDRVELGYLDALLARRGPVFGLARTAPGYLLLDRNGLARSRGLLAKAAEPGRIDLLGRLNFRDDPSRLRAEADLRRASIGRATRWGLKRLLRSRLSDGTVYLNIGHTNLSARVMSALGQVPDARIGVFVHDTIPLDLPDSQRPGVADRFRSWFGKAVAAADVLIAPSQAVADAISRHGAHPAKTVVGALPIHLVEPETVDEPPFFLCAGTIDARKNQRFLLDLWDSLPDPRPRLILAGQEGWLPDADAQRLAGLPGEIRVERIVSDARMAGLMQNAIALLHPSYAEGFGLTVHEAVLRGTPVVCNDLAVYREQLGEIPVYAPVDDLYHWKKAVLSIWQGRANGQSSSRHAPDTVPRGTWSDHLNQVLSSLC